MAEADVYMAYGRDAQAEEILQDASKADPGRAAIHLKLLEIYAQRRSTPVRDGGERLSHAPAAWGATGRRLLRWGAGSIRRIRSMLRSVATRVRSARAAGRARGGTDGRCGGRRRCRGRRRDHSPRPHRPGRSWPRSISPRRRCADSHSQMRDTWTLPGELNKFASGEAWGAGEPAGEGGAGCAPGRRIPFDTGALDFELDLADDTPTAMPDLSATTPGLGREFDLTLEAADEAASPAPAFHSRFAGR